MTEETKQEEKKLIKLDLACGSNKQPGYIGVDIVKTEQTDIVHDLNVYPYPFEDNSIDEIYCSHFIEHVEDIIKFMDECHRILKPGSKMTVIAPYYSSIRAWQDPTHKRAISEMSFLYYNKKWREDNKLQHYNIKCDYDFQYGYVLMPEYQNRVQEHVMFAISHYINVVSDIQVTLTKRQP